MKWMELAWAELGVAETSGAATTPAIRDYFRDAGHAEVTSDETAWCAAFVGAMLQRAGIAPTGSLLARSYASFGAPSHLKPGAIVVLSRTADPTFGHVGFCVSHDDKTVTLIGGNQANRVTAEQFDRARVVAVRWPEVIDAVEVAQADAPAASRTERAASPRSPWQLLIGSRTIGGAIKAAVGGVILFFEHTLQLALEAAAKVAELGAIKPLLAEAGANTKAVGIGLLVWGVSWTVFHRIGDEGKR